MKSDQINKRLLIIVIIENVFLMLVVLAGLFYGCYRTGYIMVSQPIKTISSMIIMIVYTAWMVLSPLGMIFFIITAVEIMKGVKGE